MEDAIRLNYEISPDDFTRAGEASGDVKRKLKQLGVSPEAVRKVAIAMYEGEINMVIQVEYPIAPPISSIFLILFFLIYFIMKAIESFSIIGMFLREAYSSISSISSFIIHLLINYIHTTVHLLVTREFSLHVQH